MSNETVVKVCVIPGCDGKVLARGWCRKHYSRWRTAGRPDPATWDGELAGTRWHKPCVDCGGETNPGALRCPSCHYKSTKPEKYHCPVCGREVKRRGSMCQPCSYVGGRNRKPGSHREARTVPEAIAVVRLTDPFLAELMQRSLDDWRARRERRARLS